MSDARDRWWESRFTGILAGSGPIAPRAHDPEVSLHAGTVPPWGPRHEALAVGGAGWTDELALLACAGEAVERLEPWVSRRDDVVSSSVDAWPRDERPVHEGWVLFHPEQYGRAGFPFRPFTRATTTRWVCFRDLAGEPAWVPEELAFLHTARHVVAPSTSSGLSCGRGDAPVLLRGLQEIVERDALLGAWWGRYALEEWPPARVLDEDLRARVVRPNLAWRFFRVATPFAAHATIATLAGEDGGGFVFSVGSCVRETRAASWRKSILEAVQGRHFIRWLRTQRQDVPAQPRDFTEHAAYYSFHPEELSRTAFARARSVERDADEAVVERTPELAARVAPRPVLFRNVTPPAIASEVGDWLVLRVLVPGLQPLHATHDLPLLGGPLWAPRGLAEWASTTPHPFP